jgi:transcriptional regulator with XRE-family HTH domain
MIVPVAIVPLRPHDDMASRIGQALLAARAEMSTSQRELAGLTGLTQSQIAQFERAERPPSLREFARIVAVYPQLLRVAFLTDKKAS